MKSNSKNNNKKTTNKICCVRAFLKKFSGTKNILDKSCLKASFMYFNILFSIQYCCHLYHYMHIHFHLQVKVTKYIYIHYISL